MRKLWLALALLSVAAAQDRESKVRSDREKIEAEGFWIYNDVEKGFAEAKRTGRPLLVVFRCIPCTACVQIDARVAERDPKIRALLEQYVCVRVVHANAMDLSLFQFDYDQSWAAFLMNADRTIYGRYGTRSHQTRDHEDISIEGFGRALEGGLELHREFPKNREALAAKRGPPSAVSVPEELPSLKDKYKSTLDYEGKVVPSCIHCHQVGEAMRSEPRAAGKPIPPEILFPYPHPKVLGLILDPKRKATVLGVSPESPAEQAGFKAGDEILKLEGQPILSLADVQWVLHRAGDARTVKAEVSRGATTAELALALPEGWRRKGDISWRATSWDLRRMVTGGLLLRDDVSADRRTTLGLKPGAMALRVEHVGQYGDHAAGKRAGFRKDDVIVSFAGRTEAMSDSELMAQLADATRPGDTVPVVIVRGTERMELQLPMK